MSKLCLISDKVIWVDEVTSSKDVYVTAIAFTHALET